MAALEAFRGWLHWKHFAGTNFRGFCKSAKVCSSESLSRYSLFPRKFITLRYTIIWGTSGAKKMKIQNAFPHFSILLVAKPDTPSSKSHFQNFGYPSLLLRVGTTVNIRAKTCHLNFFPILGKAKLIMRIALHARVLQNHPRRFFLFTISAPRSFFRHSRWKFIFFLWNT